MLLWIIDHIYGNIFITDGSGNILFVNQNTVEVLGIPREKLLTMNAAQIIQEGIMTRSTALEAIEHKKTIMGGFQTREGEEYLSTSTPLLDCDGRVQLVMTYSQKKSSIQSLTDAAERERKNAEHDKYVTKAAPKQAKEMESTGASEKETNVRQYERLEQKRVLDAMLATNGNKSKAARMLGISPGKLYRLLEKYKI